MLTDVERKRVAGLIAGAVRVRYPQGARRACEELFLEEVTRWELVAGWKLGEGEELRAAVVLTDAVQARWGAPEAWLHVVVDPTSEAMDWVAARIDEIAGELPDHVSCRIPVEWSAAVEPLLRAGFGVAKLGLGGSVADMRARLETIGHVQPASLGLELAVATTMADVRASSALRRDYFLSHPEHGWASAQLTDEQQREIDARVEREMSARLEQSNGTDWVIRKDGEVVGCFGLTAVTESEVVGRNASFNICLAPVIQRQGLGTLCYRTMVDRASELGVAHLQGATSNPGVMRIGARIGRRLDNLLLRRDAPWVAEELWRPFLG